MHGNVTVASSSASNPNAANDILRSSLIHEIFQSGLVRILKLKFVVVRQQSEEK
jgi:hypothetical protein